MSHVELLLSAKPERTASKHNRTLSLEDEEFVKLYQFCSKRNIAVSHVIDCLIKDFNARYNTEEPK